MVDSSSGQVASAHAAAPSIPRGRWIGIATDPAERLVLASADQEVVVFDPAHATEVARFPARVAPAVRMTNDECSLVAAGARWIALANPQSGVLSLYDASGRDLGTRRLDQAMHAGVPFVTAIGATGIHLAAASNGNVRTFEVRINPSCGAAAAP
jgi:hypothetical protein